MRKIQLGYYVKFIFKSYYENKQMIAFKMH